MQHQLEGRVLLAAANASSNTDVNSDPNPNENPFGDLVETPEGIDLINENVSRSRR